MRKKSLLFLFCLIQLQVFSQPRSVDLILTNDDMVWLTQHKDNIRYAPNPSWPPGDFINDEGVHQGIVADYIRIFEEKLDVSFNRVYFKNWNQIYTGLLEDKVDFVGAMQQTDERDDDFAFTDVFLKVPLVILVRNDYLHELSTDQIQNMELASVKGYITQTYVKDTFHQNHIMEYDDDLTALIQTSLGNTNGTIIDLMSASYLVQKYGINNLSIGKELDFTWQLRFAFRKEHAQLASIINSVLKTIDNDKRREIFNKWVNISHIPAPSFLKKYLKHLIILGILFLSILLLFLNYTLILKKQVRKRTQELSQELIEKKIAINLSKKNEARLESLFEISRHNSNTKEELLNFALNEAIKLTESKLVLLYLYDRMEETFSLSNYLNKEDNGQLTDFFTTPHLTETLGICGDIITKKEPFQIDTCLRCISKGTDNCPLNSAKLTHSLIIPINEDQELEAVLFLANKETNYDQADAKQLVLLMSSVWKLLSRQKWQEQLITAKAKAEESDKLKSAFLANLSHEIRTPMNGILGFTELLKETDLTLDKRDKYINIIHNSSHYLLSVITDIIEISKIDSGLIHPKYTALNITKFIDTIIENILITIPKEKDIQLILAPTAVMKNTVFLTDETKLRQVIENLISNAIKFTEAGTINIGYSIKDGSLFEFYVKDTGVGIHEKYHQIIFERFRQGEKEISTKKGGSGLGLAISKAYIDMLEGSIEVESQLNIGSTFKFSIPIKES